MHQPSALDWQTSTICIYTKGTAAAESFMCASNYKNCTPSHWLASTGIILLLQKPPLTHLTPTLKRLGALGSWAFNVFITMQPSLLRGEASRGGGEMWGKMGGATEATTSLFQPLAIYIQQLVRQPHFAESGGFLHWGPHRVQFALLFCSSCTHKSVDTTKTMG